MVGDPLQISFALDADHGLPVETERHRVGHGHDLHDAAVQQPLDPLPDGRLGKPDGLADGRVGAAAVLLKLLDDSLGRVVQDRANAAVAPGADGPVPPARAVAVAVGEDDSPWRVSHAFASFASNRVMVPAGVN